MSAAEDLNRSEPVTLPSERSFGLVMTAFFALLGVGPLLRHHPLRPSALVVSGAFLLLTLVAPRALRPLNFVWFKLGLLLNAIVSPIVLAVLFYGVFWPMGFAVRFGGRDPLRLRRAPAAKSYWVVRQPPGPPPQTMRHQF